MAEFLCLNWSSLVTLVDKLTRPEADPREQVLIRSPPYGYAGDIVNLLYSMLAGQRFMELLEARQQCKELAGWEWWHFKALHLAIADMSAADDPDPIRRLATVQPDPCKLRGAAEAMDAFNRWYLAAHRRMDAYVEGQAAEGAPTQQAALQGASDVQAAEQQEQAGQLPACATEEAAAVGQEQVPAATAGGGQAADATAVQGAADEELEPYSICTEANEVLLDWVLRGLAAASLAQVEVPPEVAAAAAERSGAAAATLAAWVEQHKQGASLRLLHVLGTMQRDGALPTQLLECIGHFVVNQPGVNELVTSPAARRHLLEAAAAGVDTSPAGAAAQQAALLKALQAAEATGAQPSPADGETAGGELVPTQAALMLLPLMPLSSLHQLLAFVCVQLCWSADSMRSVREALQPGDEGLLAALLELQPGRGKGSSSEAAVTLAGLEWLLLSHTHPQAPFPLDHFQDGEAPVADMAAQLAALIQPPTELDGTAAAGCPASDQGAAAQGEPADGQGSAASARSEGPESSGAPAQAEGGASHAPNNTSSAAAVGTAVDPPASAIPPYLRLGPAAASHQPPSTLQGQLRLLVSHWGLGSGGMLRKDDTEELAYFAAVARKALFYLHVTTAVAEHASKLYNEALEMVATAEPGVVALKGSLAVVMEPVPAGGLQLPNRPAQSPEKFAPAAIGLLLAASAADHLASMLNLTELALSCRCWLASQAAVEGVHIPAAQRAVEQAATDGELEEAEAAVRALQAEADLWRGYLEDTERQLREHKVLELCRVRRQPSPHLEPHFQSLGDALKSVEAWRQQRMAGSGPAREEAEQAVATALRIIDDLEKTVQDKLRDADSIIAWLHTCGTAINRKMRSAAGAVLMGCRVHVPWLVARTLVRDLLPAALEAELSAAKAADDARALLLEEDKERERRRQLEAERREAERKAKAKKAKKAAGAAGGVGGGGKGAGRADWRDELADVAAGEADGAERSEDEDEVKPLTEEQAANLASMWEQADGSDEDEWQQAGVMGRQQQQRQQQEQQRGRVASPRHERRPAPGPAVIAVRRPGIQAPGTAPPAQQLQATAAAADSHGSAAGAGPGGWSWEQGGSGERALEGDDDMDALLANMDIRSPEAPPLVAESDEEDDPELAAAIAASLAHASGPLPPAAAPGSYAAAAGGYAAAVVVGSRGAGASSPGADEPGIAGAVGLRNEAGEYNCFLNVIVQCLWQCGEFRQQVASWGQEIMGSDPVLAALHSLFQAFQQQRDEEEQERGSGSSSTASSAAGSAPPSPARPASAWGPPRSPGKPMPSPGGHERALVDPTPLRQALAALPGRSFQQGEMHDPAEVLLCVYEKIIQVYEEQRLQQPEAADEAALPTSSPTELQRVFGLAVREEVHCGSCGKATHQAAYEQFFYTTQATGLRYLFETCPGSTTGRLLRELEAQHHKSCDADVGGCGLPNSVNHFLERAPRVFTLQLTWESHSEQPADIAATLAAIDEEVDLGEVYQGAEVGAHRYRLRSMVCYYGQHYQALVLVPEAGGWLMFDDTRVARVGGWDAVRRKCEAGRIQPSVLFYEAA